MTEGRRAFSRAAAMAEAMVGGSAIIEAVAAQNFRKPRRDTPCSRKLSPRVLEVAIIPPVGLDHCVTGWAGLPAGRGYCFQLPSFSR